MTREQAKQNLIGLGITEPTDEAVTNYLNQVNGESQAAKAKAEQYKKDADKVKDLTAEIEAMKNANLTDIEKANKATDEANQKIAELQKNIAKMENQKKLAEMGIVGEDAEKLIHEDGSIDFEVLSGIISNRENAAATKKEQEIANNATNPNGGSSNENGQSDKPEDVLNAEGISFGNSVSQDAKDYYKL